MINKCTWKPVKISGLKDADNLLGVEICTDYSLLNKEKGKKRKKDTSTCTNKIKNKKQKKDNKVILTPSTQGCTVANNIEVDLFNPNTEEEVVISPWCNFGLSSILIKNLNNIGFKDPTEIQRLTLPSAVLGKRDILGAAETGSGKTFCFGIPMLNGILSDIEVKKNISKELYGLILTPTRELAVQIKNHLEAISKYTNIQIALIVGGLAAVKQERILKKGPQIVVATPGRLWELIQLGNTHLSQIDNIKYLAIDETDRMLEKGHFDELENILERINENNKEKRQNFVFSATLSFVHDLPKYLKFKKRKITTTSEQKLKKIIDILNMKNPKIVDLGKYSAETLTECRIICSIIEKDYYLYYFLKKYQGRTIIFCNSIGCVKRLTNLLNLLNCSCLPLHASMQQKQRLKNLEKFHKIENSILIATDVAARGLDIPNVEHVLHYQTPRTSESYIHRSGRTARASREGLTILIMEPSEFQNYMKLCKNLNKEKHLPLFPVDDYFLNEMKKHINLARELDKLNLQIRKHNNETNWFKKATEEMDLIVDEFSNDDNDKNNDICNVKNLMKFKRKQLDSLLMKPIFLEKISGKYPNFNLIQKPNSKALEVMKMALNNSSFPPRKKMKFRKNISKK